MAALHELLLAELRAAGQLDLERCSVDASHVHALKGGPRRAVAGHSGPPRLEAPPDPRRPRDPARGHRHGVTQLLPLLDAIPPIRGLRGRPRRKTRELFADRGYDFGKHRRLLSDRGITPRIARRGVVHGSGLGKVRWVVERGFAWLHAFKCASTTSDEPTSTSACSNSPVPSFATDD